MGGVPTQTAAAKLTTVPQPPSQPAPPAAPADKGEAGPRMVPIVSVVPSRLQPRKDFLEESLQELAESIRQHGIIEPLVVRTRGQQFELIAGERRWRASQQVGLKEVPVVIREADDATVLEMMLIENLQRENLNPIEEARGYDELAARFSLNQEEIAAKVGKSRAAVANSLRLLKLPDDIQERVRSGAISSGHAKVILGLPLEEDQQIAADQTIRLGWSVRALEDWVAHRLYLRQTADSNVAPQPKPAVAPDAHVLDLQNRLQQRFGSKVQIRYRKGKGAITVHFFTDDDLDRILDIFSVKLD